MKENKALIKEIHENMSLEKYKEAENLAKLYIKKYPSDEEGYIILSDIYDSTDKYDISEQIIKTALSKIEGSVRLFDRLATNYLYSKKIEEAKDLLLFLIKNDKATSMTYGNMGIINVLDGDNREAISYYKKSLELDNTNITTIINLAMAYSDLYIYDEAIRIFKDALKIEDSQTLRTHIKNTENKLLASKFDIGQLVELPMTPKAFHILVPENFNSFIEKGMIKIQNDDNKILILISYEERPSTDDDIKVAFINYQDTFPNIDSIIDPFYICYRPRFEDKYASTIFIEMPGKDSVQNFHAISLITKGDRTLFVTLSAKVQITNKFLDIVKTIIESIHFNEI